MQDGVSPKPPGRGRGRPFEKGRSGNPAGRRPGSRNRATLAAAVLLEGESEGLTRRAVEMALEGDPTALRLCMERLLPPCRERPLEFSVPKLTTAGTGEARGPSPHSLFLTMDAVISALARGEITPGEAERIAGTVDTFVGAIERSKRDGSHFNMLQILTADDDEEDDLEDGNETGDDGEADDGDA